MRKLVISLATRGRPDIAIPTIKRTLENITLPETVYLICCDADDRATIDALDREKLPGVHFSIRDREDTVAEKWNRALDIPGDLYMTQSDHTVHHTRGFDAMLLETAALFPDGIGIVNNHLANGSFSYITAVTAKMIEFMDGKIYVEYFPYWFVDHWLDDIGRLIGRVAFSPIVTDNKAKAHVMTRELRECGWWGTFYDAMYLRRRKMARGIIDSPEFKEPEWRKEMLRNHHALTEQRGLFINGSLRVDGNTLDRASGLSLSDARYQRVKQRAIAMVPDLLAEMPNPPDSHMPNVDTFRNFLTPPTTIRNIPRVA